MIAKVQAPQYYLECVKPSAVCDATREIASSMTSMIFAKQKQRPRCDGDCMGLMLTCDDCDIANRSPVVATEAAPLLTNRALKVFRCSDDLLKETKNRQICAPKSTQKGFA